MNSRARPGGYPVSCLPVLAAALLLSATGHAANNGVFPCEQVKRDLQSLEVPVDALTPKAVDHTPVDTEFSDEQPVRNESVTPVLNLGPRVTNILRDVFDMTIEELAQETAQRSSTSPLADTDLGSEAVEPVEATSGKSELPRFQRQMLRTDI